MHWNLCHSYCSWTAAHAAAKRGNVSVLEILLEAGADKNLKATHRDFGRNLRVEDVSTDTNVLKLLEKY